VVGRPYSGGGDEQELRGCVGVSRGVFELLRNLDLCKRHIDLGLDEGIKGVVITKVPAGGRAARAGLKPGFVIRTVDGTPIKTVADFNAATKDAKSGDTLYLRIETKERTMLFEVQAE
jgi:S1-C subfamily serine protease